MIWALSQQGEPTPEFLAVLDAAIRDENGYVRRSAVHAIGELTPDPARWLPALIAACDWADDLHDESLPEAAVAALGQYGPLAHAALPRLRRFVEGPIKGRTVAPALVQAAIGRIATDSDSPADAPIPHRPAEPVGDDEPLFAVRHHDKLCYIDRLGRIVLETRYSSGGPFSNGRAIVRNDAWRAIVLTAKAALFFESELGRYPTVLRGLGSRLQKW